ncbi:hypothetical protein FNO01nite_26240 [Flavobacterium noncentrifugens]|uniref:Uncharacterized protein n=1 Tax=Flavobacterium noncentrifugens TaxID=1128970 RepID=A0A1G8ZG02_9FLAO|nr:hypothetical protein [Flavobacterium noncentrifugens]GEP51952.1 hypothetical protein FNO01nite_26240 [Flavobacterium noncentrifugens]SDK13948.1 hypothetical protein SAMN04487935_2575 [Flavobacterium noncentrifugens]
MKKNKNNKQLWLITSKADAQFTLDLLLQDADRHNLEKGIHAFLGKLKNPRVNDLFEHYPELLQEYGLEETLTGNAAIAGSSVAEIKTAGLLSCFQAILLFCADLKAHPGNDRQQRDMLQYMLKSIVCGDFVSEILQMVVGVVGADYYASFRNKTDSLGPDPEEIYKLENDPELQEHLDLMAWFCLVRVFLESAYVCYGAMEGGGK